MANYSGRKSRHQKTPSAVAHQASKRRFLMGTLFAFCVGYGVSWFYSPEMMLAFFQPKAPQVQPVIKTVALPKPQFEFYTLLTQEKAPLKLKPAVVEPVVVAVAAPKPLPATIAVAPPVTDSKYKYLVQMASFQRQEDAEQMKASLTMKGLQARINTIKQQGGVWHRVVIGPFGSRQAAEKTQSEVARSEHISGIIRRMDA
jgi:cell division protein FtsN